MDLNPEERVDNFLKIFLIYTNEFEYKSPPPIKALLSPLIIYVRYVWLFSLKTFKILQ